MNELSQFLVDSVLKESNGVDNIVVVYSGRFQPMHKGHYQLFKHLQKKFGKDNVYIGTSNKTNDTKSPFNFKEKKEIMTRLHGVPKNRVVEIRNPYNPQTILKKFDKEDTAYITVVSEKDANRLGGKYFDRYEDGMEMKGHGSKGYVYIAPMMSGGVSGTETRKALRNPDKDEAKKWAKKNAFTKMDNRTFDMVYDKLRSTPEINEDVTFIPKKVVEEWLLNNQDFINEATQTNGATEADDGPIFLYPDYNTFNNISKQRAEQIGYEVIKQIMSAELTDIDPHPIYPTGPVTANSYYPAGVIGKLTVMNQQDFKENEAYAKWLFHVTRTMALTGYSITGNMDIDLFDSFDYDEDDNTSNAVDGDTSRDLSEDINIPVKVGDTILTGRFKNKKTVVKTIGTDDHGMPTINGRKVVTFRFPKETGTIFKKDKK